MRLPYRPPIDLDRMLGFLAARAIPGVESVADGRYRRTLLLPNGTGILSVGPGDDYIDCELQLEDLRDLTAAVQRCRRLLDLDADPSAVTAALADSGPVLGPLALANLAAGFPVTSTGTSSRCGPYSDSRYRWPRPGVSGRG